MDDTGDIGGHRGTYGGQWGTILIIKLNIKLFHLACLVNKLYKILGDFTIIDKKYP